MKQVFHFSIDATRCCYRNRITYAQAPQSFKYQSIARDGADVLISDANIQLEISIHDLTPSGSVVYKERHAVTTNSLGLFTISVGAGETTDNFALIDWRGGFKIHRSSGRL
jgi:hypothetical protein